MADYIKDCHGFTDDDIQILMDDGEHTEPTADNIRHHFRKIASDAQPGDVSNASTTEKCQRDCCCCYFISQEQRSP